MSGSIVAPSLTPRPAQRAAVSAILDVLSRGSRTQLHFPCGTGKTVVSAFVAQGLDARRIAVLVPSIDLVSQTISRFREWLVDDQAAVLAICSDPCVVEPAQDRPNLATTDPGYAGGFLEQHQRVLVVGTYHSSGVLGRALRESETRLDLLVLDEAHHLSGRIQPRYRPALDDRLVPASRRLAMTATPVVLADADQHNATGFDHDQPGISMSDETLFGPVAFTYSVADAIRAGELADYRVMVVAHVDSPSNRQRLGAMALRAAVEGFGVSKALSFHNRVVDARGLARLLNQWGGVWFDAVTVTGGTAASERVDVLRRLGSTTPGVVRVVTAAHCLREGVDVPGVDAVMFAAPRSSTVHIIQAVGRCIRTAPGKDVGTIIIPVLLPPGLDDDDELAASSYAHIWKVLRALNAHDPRISEEFIHQPHRLTPLGGVTRSHPVSDWLAVLGSFDPQQVVARLVRADRSSWLRAYHAVRACAEQAGGAYRITGDDVFDGVDVGSFVTRTRSQHGRGVLDPVKADLCEQVPGWVWDAAQLRLIRYLDELDDHCSRYGSCRDAVAGETLFPSSRRGSPLGRALAELRRAYRAGALSEALRSRCEKMPEWTWEPLTPNDRLAVEALANFVAWEKTAAVPPGHVEDGIALAQWLDHCGYDFLAGTLSPELYDEILCVAPRNPKGEPAFAWDVSRLRSQLGIAALNAYVDRAGSCSSLSPGTREVVSGNSIDVYQWCSRQRWLYGQGRLDPQVRVVLEQVPGWSWNRRAVRLSEAATTPVQLPSHIAHGDRRGTSVYQCHCVECLATTREISTERFRARQAQATAHYVHAPEAARAARRLLGVVPGASLAAVAAAAGMPTALLARLQSDPQTPIPPRLARRLSQLTASEVARWVRPGTRGRTASRAAEPADPVRCQQLLRMLQEAGLTKAQIAGELGHANSSSPNLVQRSNPRPTAAAQHALECLARDLGMGGVEDNLAAKEWSA